MLPEGFMIRVSIPNRDSWSKLDSSPRLFTELLYASERQIRTSSEAEPRSLGVLEARAPPGRSPPLPFGHSSRFFRPPASWLFCLTTGPIFFKALLIAID
ncbi:hypothetical protein BDV19DRAFT_173625 [Aspergillus venezuelensis]